MNSLRAYLLIATLVSLRLVGKCVKGQTSEDGGERLSQLELGLIHLLRSTPGAQSSDLEKNRPQFVTTDRQMLLPLLFYLPGQDHFIFRESTKGRQKN